MRNSWVNEELQRYADDTNDSKCYTDTRWRHGKTASKEEAMGREIGRIRVTAVEARCREMNSPEAVEGAYVHGKNAVRAECCDEVASPDTTEG